MSPYSILGVKPSDSYEEAKKVYRSLCKTYHPDMPNGNRKKFDEIQTAWNILLGLGDSAFGQRKVNGVTHESLFNFRRI